MLNFFLLSFDIHLTFSIWILAFGLGSILSEPSPDLLSPDLYLFVIAGVTLFKIFQKTLYDFTASRKDSQTNQDKQNAL
jgi:hypothetical protein